MIARVALLGLIAGACGETGGAPVDAAVGVDATLPCRQADAQPPPDATASEQAGIGVCCANDSACTVSTSICVAGRCCFPLHDSGRRCHANSDCCSLQCSCGNTCDPSAAGGGECAPYMP
jgi:hypothetical protein